MPNLDNPTDKWHSITIGDSVRPLPGFTFRAPSDLDPERGLVQAMGNPEWRKQLDNYFIRRQQLVDQANRFASGILSPEEEAADRLYAMEMLRTINPEAFPEPGNGFLDKARSTLSNVGNSWNEVSTPAKIGMAAATAGVVGAGYLYRQRNKSERRLRNP